MEAVQASASFDLKTAAPQLVDLFLAGLRSAPPRRAPQETAQ
jgi:hypothetical protein